MIRSLLISGLSFLVLDLSAQSTLLKYSVANWYNNKKSAVSVTFDDNCPGQFVYALPSMNSRGIKGSFFVNTGINGGCTENINWTYVNNAASTGHEIGAHTVDHVNLPQLTNDSATYEMVANRDTINAHVKSQKCLTLAYPFGAGGTRASRDQEIRMIAKNYFIGARGAGASELGYNPYNQDKNPVFKMFYFQVESVEIDTTMTLTEFTAYIDSTVKAGGWFLTQYHGIESGGYGNIKTADFDKQMDVIKNRIDNIWAAPFVQVLSYHKERRAHSLSVVSEDAKKWVLKLTDTLDNSKFTQALTLRIKKPAFTITSASQGNTTLDIKTDGDTIQINAIPDGGDIIFAKDIETSLALAIEKNFILEQNVPNPFSAGTTISYSLSKDQPIKLELLNSQGIIINTLVDAYQEAGKYSVIVNSNSISPGIYFYRIVASAGIDTKRMVIIK